MYKKLIPVYSFRIVKQLINKGFVIQDIRDNNKFKNYKVYMFIDSIEIRKIIQELNINIA